MTKIKTLGFHEHIEMRKIALKFLWQRKMKPKMTKQIGMKIL